MTTTPNPNPETVTIHLNTPLVSHEGKRELLTDLVTGKLIETNSFGITLQVKSCANSRGSVDSDMKGKKLLIPAQKIDFVEFDK